MKLNILKTTLCALSLLIAGVIHAQPPAPNQIVEITHKSEKGDLYIYKAVTNETNLCNPVLFVEGFDVYNDMNWETLYPLFNRQNLITDLQQAGRDILILNFHDATLDIKKNAKIGKKAVEYINQNRFDKKDKFSVIGVSMGGLISRLALTELEDTHDVDTWISFDSPHQGANIPLGLQEYLDFYEQYSDTSTNFLQLVELLEALDSKAAKQMLLAHHSKSDGEAKAHGDHDSLLKNLQETGYPKHCKTIAISNGSGFGEKLPFNPGDKIIFWHNPLLPYIDTHIYALAQIDIPVEGTPEDKAPLLFEGAFYIIGGSSKTIRSEHQYALDNAAGGMMDTFQQLYDLLPYTDVGDDFISQSNHCFIPTVSALGIPIENISSNLAENANLLALSPFDEIHYAGSNEMHMEINANNKPWFMRAILGNLDSDSDGFDDYQEYLLGTAYDSPDSHLLIETAINHNPLIGKVALSCASFPNTEYQIWFTESLAEPWDKIDTISPSTQSCISNEYKVATQSGFYKITAELIDPAAAPVVQISSTNSNGTISSSNSGSDSNNDGDGDDD